MEPSANNLHDNEAEEEVYDPTRAIRASGAFILFTNKMRSQVMPENPGITFVQLGNICMERWLALSPEEKQQYEEMDRAVQGELQMQRSAAGQNQPTQPSC